jgi:hypothetical protein
MLNVAFNTFEWKETRGLVAGAWGALVQRLKGLFKMVQSKRVGVSTTATTTATGAATGAVTTATATTPAISASHHSKQPLIDLVASLLTTYICVTKDMGLGVGVGVAVSRCGGLVRYIGEKIATCSESDECLVVMADDDL